MSVRNIRVRNWSHNNNNSTRQQQQQQLAYRNGHDATFRYTDSSRRRRRVWRTVVAVVCFTVTIVIVVFVQLRSSWNRNTPNSAITSLSHSQNHQRRYWTSTLSLHRLYKRRQKDTDDTIVPIHSILYRTYQQQQQQQQHDNSKQQQPPPQSHRIAMLLPYTTTPNNNNDNNSFIASSMITYISMFCYSVAGTADIMDFYIFHTGIIHQHVSRSDSSDTDNSNNENDDLLRNHTMLRHCPPNVIFIHLNNYRTLAQYLLRVVDVKYNNNDTTTITTTTDISTADEDSTKQTPSQLQQQQQQQQQHKQPVMKYHELLDLVESYIQMNPYGLVEFKPALGHIFADYIPTDLYTHWGYTDLDIVFGDLSRHVTHEELHDYDIVTYTFGDQQRLYVRGQFTIHKNQPRTINQLWRHCSYLSNLDDRFESILQQSKKYHVESAEGCYSAVLFNQTNLSIKFAVKAWTDIYTDDTAYTHGVALSQSPLSGRQILYKLRNGGTTDSRDNTTTVNSSTSLQQQQEQQVLYQLRSSWFENEESIYNDRSVDLQRTIGERIRIDDPYDDDSDSSSHPTKKKPCMYWALEKYQTKLCLRDGIVNSNDIVYYINGVLYKQRYENVPILPNHPNIVTAPLFHFQEWKRSYRNEQLAPIHSSIHNNQHTFLLTSDGVIPMISSSISSTKKKKSSRDRIVSPLGIADMTVWASSSVPSQLLPLSTYCIRSRLDGSKRHTKCDTTISYHDTERVTILLNAPHWASGSSSRVLNVETDVTLVLTLQFLSSWNIDTNERLVHGVIDNLKMNIDRWYGQPCVVVISIPNIFYKTTVEYLRQQFTVETDPTTTTYGSCFMAVCSHNLIQPDSNNDADTISRKALLNMAIDMVPTRWYVSGIELERGLVISMDTSYISHRTAMSYSTVRGNIFMIPQFGIIDYDKTIDKGGDNENEKRTSTFNITIHELMRLKHSGAVKSLGDEWELDCSEQGDRYNEFVKVVDDIWMAESLSLIGSSTSDIDPDAVDTKVLRTIEQLQDYILQIAQTGMDENYEDTPLYTYNESPILLTDNLGPYDGIRTNEIVREVEAFASIRCYNSVRISQMLLMNYTLNILPMAFVTKSPYASVMYDEIQKQQQKQQHPIKRCPTMCTNFLVDDEEIISEVAWTEIKRAARTAIIWAETNGIRSPLSLDA